jgi:hypothetical protein
MTTEPRLAKTELYSAGTAYQASTPRKRNLGGAIFLAAIEDYRGSNEEIHKNAEQFLYPQTPEWQDHYDWAVALADGLDPAWLRDALDRFKDKWDGQRSPRRGLMRSARRNVAQKRESRQ